MFINSGDPRPIPDFCKGQVLRTLDPTELGKLWTWRWLGRFRGPGVAAFPSLNGLVGGRIIHGLSPIFHGDNPWFPVKIFPTIHWYQRSCWCKPWDCEVYPKLLLPLELQRNVGLARYGFVWKYGFPKVWEYFIVYCIDFHRVSSFTRLYQYC